MQLFTNNIAEETPTAGVHVSPDAILKLIRDGYEFRLCNRRALKAAAQPLRLLYPVVPVLGATLSQDFNFRPSVGGWLARAEEAGSLRVKLEVGGDLFCDFEFSPGVLVQIPEVFSFIQDFTDFETFKSSCLRMLGEFRENGMADATSKINRSPLLLTGRGLHLFACLRLFAFVDSRVLRPARHAFLDCRDFSKEGLRQFCLGNGDARRMAQEREE